jgi:hypothetical protein
MSSKTKVQRTSEEVREATRAAFKFDPTEDGVNWIIDNGKIFWFLRQIPHVRQTPQASQSSKAEATPSSKFEEVNKIVENGSINDCYTNFFSEIISRKYLFHRKKIISGQLKNITKDSLKSFAKEYILENEYKCVLCIKGNQ